PPPPRSGEGHWRPPRAVEAFRAFCLPDPRDWRHPESSPLLAPDADLRGLPPALVLAAGCDPLRDEGRAYADRLRGLGVPVDYRLEPEMIHGCLSLFNSALYPDASRRVEPVLQALTGAIPAALPS